MSIPNVIGEGAFGCVHKPSLTCSNKRISYKNKISQSFLPPEIKLSPDFKNFT